MRILILFLFITLSIAGYAQGPNTFGGVALRVNDSTTYVTNAAGAHSAGYRDLWFSSASGLFWVWDGVGYVNWDPSVNDSTYVDVKNFLPAGVTLATSTQQQRVDAWQAAIASAQGKCGIKFSGSWDLPTDELVVTDKLTIVGVGYNSALTTTDNSGTLLLVNAPVPRVYYNVIFPEVKPFRAENFVVQYRGSSNPTSTQRGIKVSSDTSINFLHKFINVTVDSFYVGMQFHNVASAEVTGCYFRNNRAFGFLNTNNESQDYGKLMMHHNVFTTVGPLAGEPDTTSHIKIEGGAGFDISYNDFYGNTDYAVWTRLKNTQEYFTAFVSSEYYFKNNKVLFVNDYAFLFMSNYGTGGTGTALTGNRIQNVQIQGNNTGFNGLIKTDGGTGSMWEFQISENFNETPLGGPTHSVNGEFRTPISLDGDAMTNVTINDNYFIRSAVSTSSTSQKAITVTGTINGKVSALGNTYSGYTGAIDIPEYTQTNLGVNRIPGSTISLDVTNTGNVYGRFTRPSNSFDNGVIFTPNGALSGSNPQFFMGTPSGQSYYTFQRYDGTTATNILNIASATNNVGIGVTAPTTKLQTTAFATAYVAKTALYTLTDADYTVEVTSGTHTQTLPTAVGIAGRQYVITNSGSGTVTVGTTSSQTFINVSATPTTLTLAQFETAIVQSNGANWLRLK